MDNHKYHNHLQQKDHDFESICTHCGRCCGSGDDPCQELKIDEDGVYFCCDYHNRLGIHKTVSGKAFHCVPIREHVSLGTLHSDCAYRKK